MHKASISRTSLGRAVVAVVAVASFWLVGDLGSICTTVAEAGDRTPERLPGTWHGRPGPDIRRPPPPGTRVVAPPAGTRVVAPPAR